MRNKLRNIKIDWANHVVAFLSALFGIYLAIRLENTRENQQDAERLKIIELAIKNEIENNLRIYRQNAEQLSDWVEYYNFCTNRIDQKGQLVIGANEFNRIAKKQPNRFKYLEKIANKDDTTLIIHGWEASVDVIPAAGLSTSSWKAGLASGLLNSMDYALLNNLSKIYDWIEKDIGTSEKALYENMLGLDNSKGISSGNQIASDYRAIAKTSLFKHDRIQELYNQITWSY